MDMNKRVSLLIEQIEENIYIRKRVKDISELNSISDNHLQRVFKSTFGIPIGRYVRGRALSSSLELLLNTDLRIIDIAIEYGFDYEQTYIRAFKKQFGITPNEFRKSPRPLNLIQRFDPFDRSRMKNIILYGTEEDRCEVVDYVDTWANFYLKVIGDAKHMVYSDNGRYSRIYPKSGYNGADSVFNIRLEHLGSNELISTIAEVKAMKKHTWWNYYSDRVNSEIVSDGRKIPTESDWEVYALMFPDEKPPYRSNSASIRSVVSLSAFKIWTDMVNRYMYGAEIFHSDYHYHLLERGIIRCYIAYDQGIPVSVASILKNGDIFSLEFIATLPEYRRKGFATVLCQAAIDEAFKSGAKLTTIRTYDESKIFGKTLGFKYL